MQFLCFLGFCVLWFVQWLCHLLPPVFYWLQGFMCVCAQVGCSVVSHWPLCDLFVDVCSSIYLGFNLLSIIFNFFNFVCSWDTRRWIKSKNTIRLILIHSQNPTEMIQLRFCLSWGVVLPVERTGLSFNRSQSLSVYVQSELLLQTFLF
jgi:hypothetical protein